MFSKAEEGEVEFEEAISWLPSHVIDEAYDSETTKAKVMHQPQQNRYHHHHHHRSKWPAGQHPPQHKTCRRTPLRPRYTANWAPGGPGMQAIFLDSGPRTCETGVFLPQTAGTNCQQSKKPACSPVLLPSRVVQALNLNVHELGLQISPNSKEPKNNPNVGNRNAVRNGRSKDLSTQCCVISQNANNSPEIFLPKEWTY